MTLTYLTKRFLRWLINLDAINKPMPDLLPSDRPLIAGGAAVVFTSICYLMHWIGYGATALICLVLLIVLLWTHVKRAVSIIYWSWFIWNLIGWFNAYGAFGPDAPTFFKPAILALAGPIYILCVIAINIYRWRCREKDEDRLSLSSHQ